MKLYKNFIKTAVCFDSVLHVWVCYSVVYDPNRYLWRRNHLNTHIVAKGALRSACALQLAYLFWLYLFCLCVSALSHGGCLATANQSAQRGQSAKCKNVSLLWVKLKQTSDTPGSFDWQIRAPGPNHSEKNSTGNRNKNYLESEFS